MKTQVVNNCEGPIYAQLPHQRNGARIVQSGQILYILPGMNLVKTEDLQELRKNEAFEAYFKAKIEPSAAPERNHQNVGKPMLEVVGKELPDKCPLEKLTFAEAAEVIRKTTNTDLLRDWQMEATKGDVRREIEMQMKKVTADIAPEKS